LPQTFLRRSRWHRRPEPKTPVEVFKGSGDE
jgi:hypothetical protein